MAHYGGVSLLWTAAAAGPPKRLAWAGSHLAVTWSPDGRFLITALQETGLHGWRIADGADLRMTGYPAKTKSVSWSAKGAWLATSGADACVCWPFRGKDGPMGKRPLEIGRRSSLVTQVAFDPVRDRLALGFQDGAVLIGFLDGSDPTPIAVPAGDPVALLAWSPDGGRLAWAGESGTLHILAEP